MGSIPAVLILILEIVVPVLAGYTEVGCGTLFNNVMAMLWPGVFLVPVFKTCCYFPFQCILIIRIRIIKTRSMTVISCMRLRDLYLGSAHCLGFVFAWLICV